MRLAAIYDIHGNLPALEAVLADIEKEGVDWIVVGGDVVPGPMPCETLATLLHCPTSIHFIRGNGEADVLAVHRGEVPARVPERILEVLHWVADELPAEHLSQLAQWPLTLTLQMPELGKVMFCHATPRDDNEIFTRRTPEHRLRSVFEGIDAAVVVCGHTHMQFDRGIGELRVINAGSVGMPFGEPGAYWVLLGTDVELRCSPYDLVGATERIHATLYPQAEDFNILQPPTESQMLEVMEAAARL